MKFDKGNFIFLDFFEGGGGYENRYIFLGLSCDYWGKKVVKFDFRRLRNEVVVVVGLGIRELF